MSPARLRHREGRCRLGRSPAGTQSAPGAGRVAWKPGAQEIRSLESLSLVQAPQSKAVEDVRAVKKFSIQGDTIRHRVASSGKLAHLRKKRLCSGVQLARPRRRRSTLMGTRIVDGVTLA